MLRESHGPLGANHDVILLDLDGVVYRLSEPIDHAATSIAAARASGSRVVFVTNNASRTQRDIAAALKSLGVDASPQEVYTSAVAAAAVLAIRDAGAAVFVAGAPALRDALLVAGLRPVDSADAEPQWVVQGFTPDFSWDLLAEATLAIRRGARWMATNADPTLPTPRGLVPGNGALVAAVAAATGRQPDEIIGKPQPLLLQQAAGSGRLPLMVGDRLDTDIAAAHNAGFDSLLVFTGTATPADVIAAVPGQRPTYVAADLRGLATEHPTAVAVGDGWQLRQWQAEYRDDVVYLAGTGTALDALRVLCAACWSADTVRVTAAAATAAGALRQLGLEEAP